MFFLLRFIYYLSWRFSYILNCSEFFPLVYLPCFLDVLCFFLKYLKGTYRSILLYLPVFQCVFPKRNRILFHNHGCKRWEVRVKRHVQCGVWADRILCHTRGTESPGTTARWGVPSHSARAEGAPEDLGWKEAGVTLLRSSEKKQVLKA